MFSRNQMHGKTFENIIKSSNGDRFSHSTTDRKRSPTEVFDIMGEDDKKKGIPTSITTTGSSTVYLSSAIRFWKSIDKAPYRIIVGTYTQENNIKVFNEIHEFTITKECKNALFGNISLKDIEMLHEGIQISNFKEGNHHKASEWAKNEISKMSDRLGKVILNPKIDSKKQRRFQCSIKICDLSQVVLNNNGDYIVHNYSFGSISLPLKIISGKRKF